MSGSSRKLMGTTAAGADFLAVEDVFQSWLYTGNGSTQTITNGIDLAGEGGLVWIKKRSGTDNHAFLDTSRGVGKIISSNTTDAEFTAAASVTSFNSDGFNLGNYGWVNGGASTYASWTFRKAPRFFDCVEYTGDGVTSRQIAHNLGIEPGMVVVKCTSQTSEWPVFHRSNSDYVYLNRTDANAVGSGRYIWGDGTSVIPPTDTVFTVYGGAESGNLVNASGQTYVAYLFAHDPLGPSGDGSDGLIACGSYTGTGAAGLEVNLGWEPQWFLMKQTNTSGADWFIFDNMRGFTASSNPDRVLRANASDSEGDAGPAFRPTATGVEVQGTFSSINASGGTYIYIAIRRGPMRAPTSGTEVFAVDNGDGSSVPSFTSGFPVDFGMLRDVGVDGFHTSSRLTSGKTLDTYSTAAEGSNSNYRFDYQSGWFGSALSSNYYSWMFRRAPGFFDVVAYSGNNVDQRQPHHLSAPPEFIILKPEM
jgi:hypothetical protein